MLRIISINYVLGSFGQSIHVKIIDRKRHGEETEFFIYHISFNKRQAAKNRLPIKYEPHINSCTHFVIMTQLI